MSLGDSSRATNWTALLTAQGNPAAVLTFVKSLSNLNVFEQRELTIQRLLGVVPALRVFYPYNSIHEQDLLLVIFQSLIFGIIGGLALGLFIVAFLRYYRIMKSPDDHSDDAFLNRSENEELKKKLLFGEAHWSNLKGFFYLLGGIAAWLMLLIYPANGTDQLFKNSNIMYLQLENEALILIALGLLEFADGSYNGGFVNSGVRAALFQLNFVILGLGLLAFAHEIHGLSGLQWGIAGIFLIFFAILMRLGDHLIAPMKDSQPIVPGSPAPGAAAQSQEVSVPIEQPKQPRRFVFTGYGSVRALLRHLFVSVMLMTASLLILVNPTNGQATFPMYYITQSADIFYWMVMIALVILLGEIVLLAIYLMYEGAFHKGKHVYNFATPPGSGGTYAQVVEQQRLLGPQSQAAVLPSQASAGCPVCRRSPSAGCGCSARRSNSSMLYSTG